MPRTQAERREATIGRLVAATIRALAEVGYAGTSVSEICRHAQVSQGGLFRHFPTRLALIVAATEQVGAGHVAAIQAVGGMDAAQVVRLARDLARSDTHAAWHEVMVAARTDADLRAAVAPILRAYERALHERARALLPADHPDPEGAETVVLTVLHAFDSEAVTRRVHSSPEVEARRLEWAVQRVRDAITA